MTNPATLQQALNLAKAIVDSCATYALIKPFATTNESQAFKVAGNFINNIDTNNLPLFFNDNKLIKTFFEKESFLLADVLLYSNHNTQASRIVCDTLNGSYFEIIKPNTTDSIYINACGVSKNKSDLGIKECEILNTISNDIESAMFAWPNDEINDLQNEYNDTSTYSEFEIMLNSDYLLHESIYDFILTLATELFSQPKCN